MTIKTINKLQPTNDECLVCKKIMSLRSRLISKQHSYVGTVCSQCEDNIRSMDLLDLIKENGILDKIFKCSNTRDAVTVLDQYKQDNEKFQKILDVLKEVLISE